MGFQNTKHCVTVALICTILCVSFCEQIQAMRPLEGDQWMQKSLIVQSLQRGPVPPIGGNPCTYIPGRSRGRCTLSEMDVAGGDHPVAHAPPAFPDFIVKFAAASTVNNETEKKHA